MLSVGSSLRVMADPPATRLWSLAPHKAWMLFEKAVLHALSARGFGLFEF